jgi:phage gp36-like protein
MSYATVGDVVNRFKPIKTMIGESSLDVSSVEIASIYIADAEAFVDGYLGAKYAVPITPLSPIITQLTSDLAIFNLLAEKSGMVPEWMDKRYNRAVHTLEMLRDGHMVLSSASVVGSNGDNFAWSSTQGTHGIFSPLIHELDQQADLQRVDADLAERAADSVCSS